MKFVAIWTTVVQYHTSLFEEMATQECTTKVNGS